MHEIYTKFVSNNCILLINLTQINATEKSSNQILAQSQLKYKPSSVSFHPLSGGRDEQSVKTTPPTPRKSHVPRGDCYYICGRFSPFPGRSKTGSLIIYQGNKSARPSLRISHRRRAIISSWSKRFTIHRVSLYRILTTRSRKWRAMLEG